MIVAEERSHCSSHSYFSSGCGDCAISELYRVESIKFSKRKIHPLVIKHGTPGPKLQLVKQQMSRKIYTFFVNCESDIMKAINKEFRRLDKEVIEDTDILFDTAFKSILWDDLATDMMSDLVAAAEIGATDGFNQLEIKKDHLDDIDAIAAKYATYRSAEMIGKKWARGDSGNLVNNPDARYVISDTTKDDLQDIISKAADDKLPTGELEAILVAAGVFSLMRAQLIARTEIAMAQVNAHLDAWKISGLVSKAKVILSPDHVSYDHCDSAAEGSPYQLDKLPFIPVHPNCSCSIEGVE